MSDDPTPTDDAGADIEFGDVDDDDVVDAEDDESPDP